MTFEVADPSTPADATPVPLGVPVAMVVQPLFSAIGLTRWRLFWMMAYVLNVGTLILLWLLNMCAPLTLQWLELSGPIYAFRLTPDEFAVFKSEACCGFPLPLCGLSRIFRCSPSDILSVGVYTETVFVSVLLVGGGACCSSPIVIESVEDSSASTREDGDRIDGLPDWARCMTQPCMMRCTGAVRDEATRVSDYNRYFLGCEVVGRGGRLRTLKLSRSALSSKTVARLFDVRDRLRGRLSEFRDVRQGVQVC